MLTLTARRPLTSSGVSEGTPDTHPERPRSSWGVLRYPAFRLYFAGSLVSNLGTWVQNTAQVLLMYQLTHSVFAVGVVISAQFAGSLFLGPTAAVVASRFGGKKMLITAQLVSALVAVGLAVLQAANHLGAPALTAGALVLGLAFTFGLPVQTALVPRLAPDTEAAMAMNSVSYNAGRALAPVLCVAVIAFTGFTWAFALNAISFAVFAATLVLVTPGPGEEPRRPARARSGLVEALRQPRIMLTLAMVAAVTFADDPILILGPALARQLNASSDWTGYFLSALGLGTILGSLRIGAKRRASKHRTGQPTATSDRSRRAARSLLLLVACMFIFASGISLWVSLLAAFGVGVAALRTGAVTQTQLVRQPAHTASVMALWAIAWAGMKPLASFTDGWVASGHGLMTAVAVVSVLALFLGIFEICLPATCREWLKIRGRRWATVWERRYQAATIPTPLAAGRTDHGSSHRNDSSQWQAIAS
jgi:MFS family permease